MEKIDVWPTIEAERKALAEDLATLGEDQWSKPSLCSRWTVWDVVAHMTATARITPAAFFGKMLTSRFSLSTLQDKDIAVQRGDSPADALARFEAVLSSCRHPPGPADTMLGGRMAAHASVRPGGHVRQPGSSGIVTRATTTSGRDRSAADSTRSRWLCSSPYRSRGGMTVGISTTTCSVCTWQVASM